MTADDSPLGPFATAWTHEAEQEVRPYAITGGRTQPGHAMRLLTLLVARRNPPSAQLGPEAAEALALCRGQQQSVAEIAAVLRQPVQVTKIILSDLLDTGALAMAVPDDTSDTRPSVQLLEAVLAGLRTKFPELD